MSAFENMEVTMHKTGTDNKSSVQKYQSSIHKTWVCFR